MLKGINKQIIEIKCPESEHFEKILLFIKSDNGYIPVAHLGAEIYEYYTSLMNSEGVGAGGLNSPKKRKKRSVRAGFLVIASFITAGLLGLLAVSLIL